ncbi:MAG: prepilin-type N-terminal cleavage/methylation domain-containing protein [Planctomycetes bacterium]|nr:prepilin-type N-terminal cleavage/methylation domain-containing protein [Planctomycetota bacterium]
MNNSGFSLLELLATIAVMAITSMGVTSVILTCTDLDMTSYQTGVAMDKANEIMEMVRKTDFTSLISTYGATLTTEGVWVSGFDVPNLEVRATDLDGMAGKVLIVVNETLYTEETFTLGFPRDLNGDGMATSLDVTASYKILPVIVKVEWATKFGDREYDLRTLIARR